MVLFGLAFSLERHRIGLKCAFKLRVWRWYFERIVILWKDRSFAAPGSIQIPKREDPTELASPIELPVITREDMMGNFEPKPDGMPYDQWLREKGVGVVVKENIHPGSGLPTYMMPRKDCEQFEHAVSQMPHGRPIEPEDM